MRKLDRTIKKLAIAIEIICIIYHFSLHKNHSQSYNSGTETDPKAEPQSRRTDLKTVKCQGTDNKVFRPAAEQPAIEYPIITVAADFLYRCT